MMLDDAITKQMTNLHMNNEFNQHYYQQDEMEYSGAEDYEYEVQ